MASNPLIRMTAIPPTPGGVAMAQIVSLSEGGIIMRGYDFVEALSDFRGSVEWQTEGHRAGVVKGLADDCYARLFDYFHDIVDGLIGKGDVYGGHFTAFYDAGCLKSLACGSAVGLN